MNTLARGHRSFYRSAGLAATLFLIGSTMSSSWADVSVFGSNLDRTQVDPAVQLAQAQRSDRAREQAIVGRLEEEIRRLNGRIEELEFEQRRTKDRLDRLVEDLESGAIGAAGGNTVAAGSTPTDLQNRSPEEALRELAEQPADGTLGSIPESAVANLPRPNPDDVAAPAQTAFSPEQQYENAVKRLQAGDYQGAQSGLESFLEVHQEHQLASNAAYWLAESHYVRQNYSAAAAAFARNYRNYGKESPKAIDNLLKLGMSLSNLGESEKACLSYEELASTFPDTPAHIRQAVNRERARAKCG